MENKDINKLIIYFITALCSFSCILMAAKLGGWMVGCSLIFFIIGLAFAHEN